MQKLPVYLYPNLFEVIVDVDHVKGHNPVMYQRTLTVQRGVMTTVQLQFKNSDQKFLNISSSTYVMNIIDPQDQRLWLTKPVTILDNGSTYALRGLGEVRFTETDTLEMQNKIYTFSILRYNQGNYEPTYSNTYYGQHGQLEVKGDLFPLAKPSTEVTTFQRFFNSDPDKVWWEYYSGNLAAAPEFQANSALHTAALYLRNFKGKVYVEATLETAPSTFSSYDIIKSKTYTQATTGIDYFNFNGVFSYVRLRYIPDKDAAGANDDPESVGAVDKLLYRS